MRNAFVLAIALALPWGARAEKDAKEDKPAAVDIADPTQARALCLATRPTDRVFFEGESVARGEAREKYVADRKVALDKLYRLRVGPEGFRLGEYNPKREALDLDLSYAPRAMQGAVTLAFPNDAPMQFEVTAQQAKEVSAAIKTKSASLLAFFELNEDQGAVCSGSVAAGVFTIAALPVAFQLMDAAGNLLARAEGPRADGFRAIIGGYSGVPTAVLGAVEADGVDTIPIAKKLTAAVEPLRKCYADRLKERADVVGAVVVGVSVRASGQVESVTFIADALGDEPLRKCVSGTFEAMSFPGVSGLPGLFRVPLELKLTPQK